MNPLSLVPSWVYALAIAALAVLLGVQTVRLAGEEADHANTRTAFANERTLAAQAGQRAESAARTEERRKTEAVQEIANATRKDIETVRLAHVDAERSAVGLRGELAAFVATARRSAKEPSAAGGSPPADTALDLLAELFNRADAASGELAQYADRARIAGQACERAFEALTP